MHLYEKFIRLAAAGFTDLNLFTLNSIKVAYLPIDPTNFTVNMPDDLVMYTKIGIDIGGRMWTLTYNQDIINPRKVNDCGKTLSEIQGCTDSDEVIFGFGGFYFAEHFRNGQYVGELYGTGGGFNIGYYNIDWERRLITLNNEVSGHEELVVEYKSNGIQADGSTVIPRQAVAALVEYIHWKRIEYDGRIPVSQKQLRQIAYEREYEKLKFYEDAFTVDEYLDHTYSHYQSTPRR